MAFQLYRGTDAQVTNYTGASGELVYNMTNQSLHIMDGTTVGGFEIQNADTIKNSILDGATTAFDTLKEIEAYINDNTSGVADILTNMSTMQAEIDALKAELDALKIVINTTAEGDEYTFGASTP